MKVGLHSQEMTEKSSQPYGDCIFFSFQAIWLFDIEYIPSRTSTTKGIENGYRIISKLTINKEEK